MTKTISNSNNILKSTAINYNSFVRIAKIIRPSNISFTLKQYYYDDKELDGGIINYGEDIYTIYYKGESIGNNTDYTPTINDFSLKRNTCNIYPIRCAIEVYNGEAYICVPSQGLYDIVFNNMDVVPLQIFQTSTKEPISSENNLIKEKVGRDTFKNVDWITTSAQSNCCLSSLLTNESRVIKLILLSYNYQTSYINIEINGGEHSTIYANIDGAFSEHNIKFYLDGNKFKIKISSIENYRIGVLYDSGRNQLNETREFYRLKQINESDFDDTKVADFIPIPNIRWIFNSDSYKYIKPNTLIYDSNLKKVIITGSSKKDVFGRRFDYPYANSYSDIVNGNKNLYICNCPSIYRRVSAVVFINNSQYKVTIYNNNNNVYETTIVNDTGSTSLQFFIDNNKLYCHTDYDTGTHYHLIVLSNDVCDIDNNVVYNEGISLPIISNNGTFAKKPNNPSIGFAYFCTDKQTTEGNSNGIMIYHKGNNVWVDALGRVVE